MAELEPLPGRPDELLGYTGRYDDIAEQLRSASRLLQDIANDEQMIGLAIAKVRSRVSEASSAILAAEPRYAETSSALAEYAVKLETAQSDANDAIRSMGEDAYTLAGMRDERDELTKRYYVPLPLEPEEQTELEAKIHALDSRISTLDSSVRSATAAYEQAVDDRDAAANRAIDRIHDVLDRGADSLWDKIRGGWEDLTGGISAIGDWIWNVALPVIIDAVIVIEALSVLFSPAALALLLAGVVGIVLFGLLSGKDGDGILNDLIAAASSVLPKLSAGLQLLLLREALTPTPEVKPLTPPGGLTGESLDPPYAGIFVEDGQLDTLGGADSTLIEIVEVIGADGTSSWRVVLPSTQDWQFATDPSPDLSDKGGLNDLGSNLALMLTPSQEAAYQRAVIQAMTDAGIGPDDPVMLTGWSQGGMVAGRLASDPNTPGDVQAIVVAGSPIDSMPIPKNVTVLSVQQPGDLVPKTDGQRAAPSSYTDDRKWATVDGVHSGVGSHSAVNYGESAKADLDSSTDPIVQSIKADQANFFGTDERRNIYEAAG